MPFLAGAHHEVELEPVGHPLRDDLARRIAETTTGFYLSTGYKDVPGLVLLLIVLAIRPAGLFGKEK